MVGGSVDTPLLSFNVNYFKNELIFRDFQQLQELNIAKMYSEPCQTSKKKRFAKITSFSR